MFSTSITIGDFVTFFISPKNSELKKVPTIITKIYWQIFCLTFWHRNLTFKF
jgi:hypothetical protein